MLASSLGAKILTVGFDAVGKGYETSCASIPPSVDTKVENGSYNGAVGIGDLPTLQFPALELATSKVFETTPSIAPFPLMSLYGFAEVIVLGTNSRIGKPCQVKSFTTRPSIGSCNITNLSKNMGVTSIVRLIHK